MCEILLNNKFALCQECNRNTAFGSDHPYYIACTNSKKGVQCSELSARLAAAEDPSIEQRDCIRCGSYCGCANESFYSCAGQGWDYDDNYLDNPCCEFCDTKLYIMRAAEEQEAKIEQLECLSNRLPTLKAELAEKKESFPEKSRLGSDRFAQLTKKMQTLAFATFTQTMSVTSENVSIYPLSTHTKELAEVTSQLVTCQRENYSLVSSVRDLEQSVKTTESEISLLSRQIASYLAAQNPHIQIHPV